MYSKTQTITESSGSESMNLEEKQDQEIRQSWAQLACEKIKSTNFMNDASVGLVWKLDSYPEAVQHMVNEEELEFLEDTADTIQGDIWLAYIPHRWFADYYVTWVQNKVNDATGCASITDRQLSRDRLLATYKPTGKPILVWEYKKAPEELQAVANSGGDEDWIAFVPKELSGDSIQWLRDGYFGCCRVRSINLPDGGYVAVGQHA